MKRPLLLSLIILSLTAGAHAQTNSPREFRENVVTRKQVQANSRTGSDTVRELISTPLALINPAPGVHRLKQDNMPCMVPDLKDVAAIPNFWKSEIKVPYQSSGPRIPMPRQQFRFFPSRPLLIIPEPNKENTK